MLDPTTPRICLLMHHDSAYMHLHSQVFKGFSLPSNQSGVLGLQPVKQALPRELAACPHDVHLLPEA
jgi:hypothetical protein